MFNKKLIAIIVMFSCFFKNAQASMTSEEFAKQLGKMLTKPVSYFIFIVDYQIEDRYYYTTELSKLLLGGNSKIIESGKSMPIIWPVFSLASVATYVWDELFDTRLAAFMKKIEECSQQELQEAIKDALLLSKYSNHGYFPSCLLNYLVEKLQNRVFFVREQVKYNFTYDQESYRYMTRSLPWAIGFLAVVAIASRYDTREVKSFSDFETMEKQEMSPSLFLGSIAMLGAVPTLFKTLKGAYKVLTTDPNAYNQYLEKYEQLLAFVQNLKNELDVVGFITFKLPSGYTATVKDFYVHWQEPIN